MKRIRADSAESAVTAMLEASLPPLEPPEHVSLREGDRPFWDGVVRARARDEWTECDLVICAQLARVQADIERESITLDSEDMVVTNDRGTNVVNARVAVLQQLAQRDMAVMRSLRMGGRVSGDAQVDATRRSSAVHSLGIRPGLCSIWRTRWSTSRRCLRSWCGWFLRVRG
jgi:hypothetical protein